MKTEREITESLPPAPPPEAPSNGSSSTFPRVRPMHGRTTGPTRRSTRGQWTPEEDEILRNAVELHKGKNWKKIAECFKDRTDVQCLHRWQKVLNPELIKGPWSKEEDEAIIQLVNKYGPNKWSTIAQHLPGRIGKQCRERWHNHLNPGINKEAWTQEEELVLIRAHQMHGNKWAQLTKYLPGRTDNAIKNHWNSSVRKKLDSFIASGLLSQFQVLPAVSHQNQSIPGDSLRVHHSSGDGSGCKGGAEAEENSECSQVGCSQTASDMSNTACQPKGEFVFSDKSDHGKVQTTSSTGSYSEWYYTSIDDNTFTIPDIPCEFSCSPKYLDENVSIGPGTYTGRDGNFDAIALLNVALELTADSSNLSGGYFLADTMHESALGPSHLSTGYGASAWVNDMVAAPDFSRQELTAVECPSSLNLTKCSDIDLDRFQDSLGYYQSSFHSAEMGGTVALQPYSAVNATTMGETLRCQNLSSIPSQVSDASDYVVCPKGLTHVNGNVIVYQEHEVAVNAGFSNTHNISDSPGHDHINAGLSEEPDLKGSTKLAPVNTFGSVALANLQVHPSEVGGPTQHTCKLEAGTLYYESPRFPSLDIPFFSCDLAQSGTDVQQEFSPLGIRQLMMSSMNSLTPFKLWDSPTSEDSPDAMLKSAAKTFACPPSILKKRHRDLLSPLSPFSERRYDKKIGNDVNKGFLSASKLTKEFSRLDVMVNEADNSKEAPSPSHDQLKTTEALSENKENIYPASQKQTEEANDNLDYGDKTSEAALKESDSSLGQDSTIGACEDHTSETHREMLVECHFNDTWFSSPVGARPIAGSKLSEGASETYEASKKASRKFASLDSGTRAGHFVSPCTFGQKKEGIDCAVSSGRLASDVSSVMAECLVNDVGAESLNIFGGTPFRRSIESPSAWKSPWYFSSLVPCLRFDSDITIEDIGIFMSPGEGSIDALGLMKQINEQSADAYADAREVLGSDTPEIILRRRSFRNQNSDRGTKNVEGDCQHEGRLRLASNVLTERRILDFSECGTPQKSSGKEKCVSATSLSSPSLSVEKLQITVAH